MNECREKKLFICLHIFSRLDFIQDYTLKSLRLKQDKWNKLVLSDGQREYILSFIEKGEIVRNVYDSNPLFPCPTQIFLKSWSSLRILEVNFRSKIAGHCRYWKAYLTLFRFTLTGRVLFATKESSSSSGKPSRYLRMPRLLWITWHAAMSTPTLSVIFRANYWPVFSPYIGRIRVEVFVCFRPFLRAGWGGFCPCA